MNAADINRHRQHLARLAELAGELDQNVFLALRELAKIDKAGTVETRTALAQARCALMMVDASLKDAVKHLPDHTLLVVA